MSFLNGTLTPNRFVVLGPVPDEKDLAAALKRDAFTPFEDGLEEERRGWCDWRNPFITPADPDYLTQESTAFFGLRTDTRKIPATTLKGRVDLRLRQLMLDRDLAFVGKEARISIVDEVKVELLPKVLPSTKSVLMAWRMKEGELWTDTGGISADAAIKGFGVKSFGAEIRRIMPMDLVAKVAPEITMEQIEASDAFCFGPGQPALMPSIALGHDFLVWLWWRGLHSGESGQKDDLSAFFVDDAMGFVADTGDVKTLALSQGNPAESAEAFEAINSGKHLSSIKARILSGDMEWTFTLDAETLTMHGLKLPPSSAKDPSGRIMDRLFLVEEAFGHLDRRFAAFIRAKVAGGMQEEISAWIQQGLDQSGVRGYDSEEEEDPEIQAGVERVNRDPGARKALGKLMSTLAEHGTEMTVETGGPNGRKVMITADDARRAAERLRE